MWVGWPSSAHDPVVLDVARDINEVAPAHCWSICQPFRLVTEALFRYAPDVEAVGVCNVSLTTKMAFLEKMEAALGEKVDPQEARLKVLGLNHLTWFYGFEVNGQDLWPQIMDGILAEAGNPEEIPFDRDTLQSLQMLPNYYLKYYYYTKEMLAQQENGRHHGRKRYCRLKRTCWHNTVTRRGPNLRLT